MSFVKLVTREQWDKMSPRSQGYVLYTQGGVNGSELWNASCPYPKGSKEYKDFSEGERIAVLDAQDSEE
jgi:hypothetical protein